VVPRFVLAELTSKATELIVEPAGIRLSKPKVCTSRIRLSFLVVVVNEATLSFSTMMLPALVHAPVIALVAEPNCQFVVAIYYKNR
jgi:hypothetical protein